MGKKDKVVPIVNPVLEARQNFASHVQSIAFNLTLSRRMIDCLQSVRDYGWPHLGPEAKAEHWQRDHEEKHVVLRVHTRGTHTFTTENFVGFMRSLSNRGLIFWDTKPYHQKKQGERTIFLSRAGELTCDLLVEAGLMAPAAEARKKANR